MPVRNYSVLNCSVYRRFLSVGLTAVVFCMACARADAQLRLPSIATPSPLPTQSQPVNDLARQLNGSLSTIATELDSHAQSTLHALRGRELIRSHSDVIESDPSGDPIVRNQVIALEPSAEALTRLRAAGFIIADQRELAGLELTLIVIAPPPRMSTRAALRKLRSLDPSGNYDFNHIYLTSGNAENNAVKRAGNPVANTDISPQTSAANMGLGLIDSGVDSEHPVFHDVIQTWGCDGQLFPSAHGTAVASLLVGQGDKFRGAAAGAALHAADVYCNQPTGGAITTIISACAWLTQQHVPVINISLVGPPNILLERVVNNMIASGHLIVAAVGNDGPAAAPLYPAAYAGVVGVTGVDAQRRVLIEAGRGDHVYFAAPGADMAAASTGGTYVAVRGTSFAAPIVAGLLARHLTAPDREAAAHALVELSSQAIDLGPTGPDKIYGHGLVGESVRVAPTAALIGSSK